MTVRNHARTRAEFHIEHAYSFNTTSPWRWIASHVWRYWWQTLLGIALFGGSIAAWTSHPLFVSRAADVLVKKGPTSDLLFNSLMVLAVLVLDGVFGLLGRLCWEWVSQKFEADARDELYISLLSKSQTFHNRQRVGDIMARATDDVRSLNPMISPGFSFILETVTVFLMPLAYMAFNAPLELLILPILFLILYVMMVRRYVNTIIPLSRNQREAFGDMNAALEETVSGIEVVKASSQEDSERSKFISHAGRVRHWTVEQGRREARYLPLLMYAVLVGLEFLHAMLLLQAGRATVGNVVLAVGMMITWNFPVFISIWSFSLVQMGVAGAERILKIIKEDASLDERPSPHSAPLKGEIEFKDVTFHYPGSTFGIEKVSFRIQAGQTVAIVGQTGSGKTALIQIINRVYDVTAGQVLIDGVDVREWELDSLRSQISKIEQDIFLFSRSIAENIAFGLPEASQERIEQAAKDAQAHDFISGFNEGYQTMIGERGVTLSGGQRQRIALARALLRDTPILILDDSTSAIDSATEDEIQKALNRAKQGRTTLLITHRLSQIRWADHILVLDQGRLVADGTHEHLLRRSPHYRRIFARYDAPLPEIEASVA